jgi:nicotinate-nucleotide--dimethylbenzimidazole phosphoribosyltransferase
MAWPRPVPTTGDRTSSAQRAGAPDGWALSRADIEALDRVIEVRRDVRRFRADPVPPELLGDLLRSAHRAPSVGHSQPWRFVVVRDPATRQRAANLADGERLAQAAGLDEVSGRHLLDLDLEGIREAPVGIVVCCDRRSPAAGVLGRATFGDADLWSCACAIENLWLTARAAGLGVGWVTLFDPADLAGLVGAPEGVSTLGWLCVGWPDERPPEPGLERRGWSRRLAVDDVVMAERWPAEGGPEEPPSRLRPPEPANLVAARDRADVLLAPPSALGLLDRVVDRITALRPAAGSGGPAAAADGAAPGGGSTAAVLVSAAAAGVGAAAGAGAAAGVLVLAAADHPVAAHAVSAYPTTVTRHVLQAAAAGRSVGAVAATTAGLEVLLVDAGVSPGVDGPVALPGVLRLRALDPRGDLVGADALTPADVGRLVEAGRSVGRRAAASGGVVALGEVGVANTTVAAALAAVLLGTGPDEVVGLGSGADTAMMVRKRAVVAGALRRWEPRPTGTAVRGEVAWSAMGAAGGPELAVLAGACLGAAEAGAAVVLDGLATSVAALVAVRVEPAVAAHLVAGQRSRERAHGAVLAALGLEPLLDLRIRAGEGAGACLAAGLLAAALQIRRRTGTTTDAPDGP